MQVSIVMRLLTFAFMLPDSNRCLYKHLSKKLRLGSHPIQKLEKICLTYFKIGQTYFEISQRCFLRKLSSTNPIL